MCRNFYKNYILHSHISEIKKRKIDLLRHLYLNCFWRQRLAEEYKLKVSSKYI